MNENWLLMDLSYVCLIFQCMAVSDCLLSDITECKKPGAISDPWWRQASLESCTWLHVWKDDTREMLGMWVGSSVFMTFPLTRGQAEQRTDDGWECCCGTAVRTKVLARQVAFIPLFQKEQKALLYGALRHFSVKLEKKKKDISLFLRSQVLLKWSTFRAKDVGLKESRVWLGRNM